MEKPRAQLWRSCQCPTLVVDDDYDDDDDDLEFDVGGSSQFDSRLHGAYAAATSLMVISSHARISLYPCPKHWLPHRGALLFATLLQPQPPRRWR